MPNKTLEKWEEKTLEDILDKGSSNLSANKLDNCDGEYPVYGASGLVKKTNFYQQDKEYLAIIKDGAGVGRVYHYEPKSSVLGTLQYLFPKENVNIRFAYYYLLSLDFAKYYQGAAIPHIYYKDYKNEKLVLPPLLEQQRIVGILDEAFENIEKAKQNALQNLNNAKELFENLLNGIFVNKIDGWNKKTLEEIISKEQYSMKRGPFGSSLTKSCFVPKGIRVFEQYNPINNDPYWARYYITKEKYEELKAFTAKAGDLLVSCSGVTLGRIVELPDNVETGIINQALLKIKLDNSKILNKFFIYLFRSKDFQNKIFEYSQGVAIPNMVGVKELKKIKINYPSIEEQQKIVAQLDELQEQTKKLEQIYEQKLKDLDELKQSILQKAFNGEL